MSQKWILGGNNQKRKEFQLNAEWAYSLTYYKASSIASLLLLHHR